MYVIQSSFDDNSCLDR